MVALLLLGTGVGAMLTSAPASADYAKSFQQGLRAVDFEDWNTAAALMQVAIREQPPGAIGTQVRIYGTRFERYLPHYYLGLAYYRQGLCQAALEAFADSRRAGALGGVPRGKAKIFENVCHVRLGLPQRPAPPLPLPSTPTATPQTSQTSPRSPTRQPTNPGAPSVGNVGSSPPAPHLGTTADVHRRQLDKLAAQAQSELRRGEKLADRLDEQRRAGAAAFRNDPGLGPTLDAARQLLHSARFLYDGGRLEGDLVALERARDDAQAAAEELELIARRVGK